MFDEVFGTQPLFFVFWEEKIWSSFLIEDKIHILKQALLLKKKKKALSIFYINLYILFSDVLEVLQTLQRF